MPAPGPANTDSLAHLCSNTQQQVGPFPQAQATWAMPCIGCNFMCLSHLPPALLLPTHATAGRLMPSCVLAQSLNVKLGMPAGPLLAQSLNVKPCNNCPPAHQAHACTSPCRLCGFVGCCRWA